MRADDITGTIVVATASKLKIDAVTAVFPNATVIGVKTKSGVNEQPIDEETYQGAQNRLHHACQLHPDADYYISIENGIYHEKGRYIDKAVVMIADNQAQQSVNYSCGVEFPSNAYFVAQQKGFANVSVGQVMFDMGLVAVHDDPHASLGDKLSRQQLLTETIAIGFEAFEQTIKSSYRR